MGVKPILTDIANLSPVELQEHGVLGENRTHSPSIKSRVLCQLSYKDMVPDFLQ